MSGVVALSGDTIVTVLSASKITSTSISSDPSVSSESSLVSTGGVGAGPFPFLLCLDFLVTIDCVQDLTSLTFLGTSLRCLVFSIPSWRSSSTGIGEGSDEATDVDSAGSETELERVCIEGSLRRDSKRKKLRRLAGTVGEVGLARPAEDVADDGLLRSKSSPWKRIPLCISKTQPAVLGRDSSSTVVLSEWRPVRADCGLEVPLMTEDRLFVAEWPRKVDMEVSVSDEMVDSGRMYSTLSEKPTRARDGGRGVLFASSAKELASRNDGCDMDLFTECPKTNGAPSAGVTGALPARGCAGGFMIEERSWEETAPERR